MFIYFLALSLLNLACPKNLLKSQNNVSNDALVHFILHIRQRI